MDRAVFDRMAELDQNHWWFTARRRILAQVIERVVRPPANARILELGCGTGHNLDMLARFGRVEAIRRMPERNRFMKGLFAWSGFRQAAVEYDRGVRSAGETKFRYWRLWTLALDGLTSASTMPLRIWSYIGVVIAMFSLIYAVFVVVKTVFLGIGVPGYPSLMVAVLFFGGLQLLSLGVLGEYVGRILIETKQRPLYVVRDRVGIEERVG